MRSDLSLAELTNDHLMFPVKHSGSPSGIPLRVITRFRYHFCQPTRLNLNSETIFLCWQLKIQFKICFSFQDFTRRLQNANGALSRSANLMRVFLALGQSGVINFALRLNQSTISNFAFYVIRKEIAIHSLYFNAFLELWLLNYLWKIRGYPHFSFWIPITLDKIYFFPFVTTFAKIHFY